MPRIDNLAQAFWSKVEVGVTNDCWPWYGPASIAMNVFDEERQKYTTKPAAHVAFFLKHKRWPEKGKVVRPYHCGNYWCMNLRHYQEVSRKQLNRHKRWINRRLSEPLPPQRMPAT